MNALVRYQQAASQHNVMQVISRLKRAHTVLYRSDSSLRRAQYMLELARREHSVALREWEELRAELYGTE